MYVSRYEECTKVRTDDSKTLWESPVVDIIGMDEKSK